MSRLSALIAAAALAAVALPAAATESAPQRSCFRATDWQNWRSPSPDVLYLRVRNKDVYRVDLAGASHRLNDVGTFLVSRVHGVNMVCSPIDLDLSVSDDMGFSTRLIAKSITKLTPEEVAAIPAKHRP